MWQRSFADPILVLDDADITGDGVKEVIVVSLKGMHVLQASRPMALRIYLLIYRTMRNIQYYQHLLEYPYLILALYISVS